MSRAAGQLGCCRVAAWVDAGLGGLPKGNEPPSRAREVDDRR
jgi:hypothetical protein